MHDYCFPPRIALLKEMARYLQSKWDSEVGKSTGANWHLGFLDRHPTLGIKYSRQIEHTRAQAQQDYFIFATFLERVCIEYHVIIPVMYIED